MSQRRKKGLPPSLSSILSGTTTRGECRLWTGATSANGYPYVYDCREYRDGRVDGKRVNGMRSARSVVWELAHGPMPEGKNRVVLTCMGKCCLSPQHMLAMSHGEAASHAAQHGAYKTIRHRVAATVNSRKRAKLNPDKASLIRHRVQANNEDRQVVADSMGVCLQQNHYAIGLILRAVVIAALQIDANHADGNGDDQQHDHDLDQGET